MKRGAYLPLKIDYFQYNQFKLIINLYSGQINPNKGRFGSGFFEKTRKDNKIFPSDFPSDFQSAFRHDIRNENNT